MSENIPEPSTSANLQPKPPSKRKHERVKLPTPPPDPTENNNESENMYECLDSLTRSTATYASLVATEEAFDHFVKLYKLMKQMFEIREQNAKLHRRIRDLEQMNNLTKLHKQLEQGIQRDCPELDKDTAFAESILESILLEIKKEQQEQKSPNRLRPSILRRQRNRSGSATDKSLNVDSELGYRSDKQSKVSKWTKVKAAFKWEKASNTISDNKNQDGGLTPVNNELARYLRVPSTSDDTGHSPVDSILAEISTPGSLSTTSSNEDFHRMAHCEGFRSSEDEHSQNYIPQSKDESNHNKGNAKFHRTPWAKMKDIIQTRNSFKKKHRLSAQSDDIQIDVELCSDNEDVFIDDNKSKSLQSSTPSPCSIYRRCNSSDIPSEIVARYQQVLAENMSDINDKKISKWMIIKQAFLSPEIRYRKTSSSDKENVNIEEEIQSNYKQLQKKISLEFQEKRSEWDRLKQSSPSTSNTTSSCIEESKDPAFAKKMEEWQKIKTQHSSAFKMRTTSVQMTREDDLPADFRKKMQEWERIKKLSGKETSRAKKKLGDAPRWKSLSGHRSETSQAFELPPLSDDFKKKLEEWRQIKASGGAISSETFGRKLKDKTPSPKLSRKNSSPKHSKKSKDHPEKELHWCEKELSKYEKEKQRAAKNKKSVNAVHKQEVLVHTPCGFYRFEGISRKFQQKLYEWEKAQGISPESSTFALLESCTKNRSPSRHSASNSPQLIRSKSADSIAKSVNILACPIISHQPSSLSLNDVEELDKESITDSKGSSMQYLNSHDDLENDEPEALIVEVEDYVEETAAPLRMFVEEQKPVYQREGIKALCEGETIAAPKVRRSESTKAQINYNLIEELFTLLKVMLENEYEIRKFIDDDILTKNSTNNESVKELYVKEKAISTEATQKLIKLQDANKSILSLINDPESACNSKLSEAEDAVEDLSSEIYHMSDKLLQEFTNRLQIEGVKDANSKHAFFIDTIVGMRNKLMELRRHLSFVCAASDLPIPSRKPSFEIKKTIIHKTLSSESKESRCDTSDTSRRSSEKKSKEGRYIKSENCNVQSQGAVKKRIKYRQKSLQNRSLPDTDEEDNDISEQRKNKPKKLCRTRSTSESSVVKVKTSDSEESQVQMDFSSIIVPTETNFVSGDASQVSSCDSPVTVFVKTTRKLFTPIGETSLSMDNSDVKIVEQTTNVIISNDCTTEAVNANETVAHLPPIPSSPGPQRKIVKDVSPSIRLMLAKYNQKINEQDTVAPKSGGSSGSASPIAWRSPTAERRVRQQTERYQEELCKLSPLLGGRRDIQKSASVGYIHTGYKQVTVPIRRESIQNTCKSMTIPADASDKPLKNLSVGNAEIRKSLTLNLDSAASYMGRHSPEVRLKKLQKAKEEFLNSPISAPPQVNPEEGLKFPTRNRLSQISVDSESSYDSTCAGALIKSASAGMINIDPDTYKQFDPGLHAAGYVSLPRSGSKTKEGILGGKFAFSNIASKFRKVRMRRGKEKMNAVSTLCRQSLVVDISPSEETNKLVPNTNTETSSGDVSPASSRTGSWIKKPKLFKR